MSIREPIKAAARGVAALAVLPIVVSFRARARLFGRDRALEGATQALAMIPGTVGQYLRRAFLSRAIAGCHPSATIEFGTLFSQTGARIDENAYIGPRCHLGLVHVERDALLAAGVHVPSGPATHRTEDLSTPIREQPGSRQRVRIGAGAWIGSAAVVMADIGRGTIVGAGAVVTKPLPDFVVAVGVPARVIRTRRQLSARPAPDLKVGPTGVVGPKAVGPSFPPPLASKRASYGGRAEALAKAGSSGVREVAVDCRFFLGDKPCVWHKREGALCTCNRYEQVSERILITKLDAMGDVLRTTALLPPLLAAHPRAAVTWITRAESVPLLENNPYLTEIIAYGTDAAVHLLSRSFDRVINLDAGKLSAGLASLARAPRKDGFVLDPAGHVAATNEAARAWLEMGVFDDLKRRNERTYQFLMADVLGLPLDGHRYVLELSAEEKTRARNHLTNLGLKPDVPIVGFNTGAGGRWQLKQWRQEGFVGLAERLCVEQGAQILLLGGPEERERNRRIAAASRVPVFDAGCDHTVRHFAALVGGCDIVVTGDTLAMHVALAMRRRVVVLFGPTSAVEIELYGLGEKVLPAMDCLSCYKTACDFVPNCMDLITVDMVAKAVARQLAFARRPALALQA